MDVRGPARLPQAEHGRVRAGHGHQHASGWWSPAPRSRSARRRRVGRRRRRTGPSPRHGVSPPSSTGLYDHLRDERIRFVDLNHDDVRVVPLRSHFTGLGELALPRELLAVGLHRLDAQAQDASLGGHDGEHEELLRRRARSGVRLAEEHPARARHSSIRFSISTRRSGRISPSSTRLPPWRETARSWDAEARRDSSRWAPISWPWTRRVRG